MIALPAFDDTWKAKCKSCTFLDSSHAEAHVMRCAALSPPLLTRPNYCVDLRDPGARCGPEATLWQPR